MILQNLQNCIKTYFYGNKVENNSDPNKTVTEPNNKRKIPFDSEEMLVKKSALKISETDDSFFPNAESTKIANDNSLNSDDNHDEHKKIIEELSLEEIDFEESFLSKEKENEDNETKNSETVVKETDKLDEYRKKLMNIGTTVPLHTLKSDKANVTNFNAEMISISQWSKGDVTLNGKPLEVCFKDFHVDAHLIIIIFFFY